MQGGGNGNDIVQLARRAAAASRIEPAALVASTRPPWMRNNYNGVHQRKGRYYAVIWNVHTARMLWLGSYATPEEAAFAYDAAARATLGHKARPNFPAPVSWPRAAPAPEEVSTKLVLALPPRPARRRDPAAAVAAQVAFDSWLMVGLAAAAAEPQHQLQQQGAPPAAPLFPQQQQQQPATNPASTELSSTEPEVDASRFLSPAAAPTQHRALPALQAGVSDLAVVEDNFWMLAVTDGGASTSAAPPPVPRLTLMDLLLRVGGLPGRGGPGGAQ